MPNILPDDVNLEKFLNNFTYVGSGVAGKTELPIAVFFETASLLKIADAIWGLR